MRQVDHLRRIVGARDGVSASAALDCLAPRDDAANGRCFETTMVLHVQLTAPDEDYAADLTWARAEDYLRTLSVECDGVRVNGTLDGLGEKSIGAVPLSARRVHSE